MPYATLSTTTYSGNSDFPSVSEGNLLASFDSVYSGSERGIAFIPIGVSTGRYRYSATLATGGGSRSGALYGLCDSAAASLQATTGNPLNGFFATLDSGYLYTNNNGSLTSFGYQGTALGPGVTVDIVFDKTEGINLAWMRFAGGNWNNNPSADPDTNTGGIDISYIAAAVPFVGAFGPYGMSVLFDTGATAYPHTMPTTFADLPANLNGLAGGPNYTGAPLEITWSDSNTVSGLNYSTDGGSTWHSCTGGTSGNSGVAVGPTPGTVGSFTIILQNAGNTADVSAAIPYTVVAAPSGSPKFYLTTF